MATNHRASLLSGLRTGGVRSASNPAHVQSGAYTSAIGGQFPRYASGAAGYGGYGDDEDHLADLMSHTLNFQGRGSHNAMPMTASAAEGTMPQFQQQQAAQVMYLQAQAMQRAGFSGGNSAMSPDQQVLQMQMDYLKLQALQQQQQQQQQFQAQMLAQAQLQQQMQQQQAQQQRRRPSEPATAGPLTTSFPGAALNRGRVVSAYGNMSDNEFPTSAALDGRFGGRPISGLNPNAASFKVSVEPAVPTPSTTSGNWRSGERTGTAAPANTPATPSFTTVISGGTPLGTAASTQVNPVPAKHDTVASWRRPSAPSKLARSSPSPPQSVRSGSPSASPPTVFVSTPEDEEPSSIPSTRSGSPPAVISRARPQPLRFSVPVSHEHGPTLEGVDQVLTVASESDEKDDSTTPTTGSSGHSVVREEAARRLYEGLGIGRPAPQVAPVPQMLEAATYRQISSVMQPARQPRGPPSGVEDLGARNFAARIRRKAIGGLGALMDARRRDSGFEVEAY